MENKSHMTDRGSVSLSLNHSLYVIKEYHHCIVSQLGAWEFYRIVQQSVELNTEINLHIFLKHMYSIYSHVYNGYLDAYNYGNIIYKHTVLRNNTYPSFIRNTQCVLRVHSLQLVLQWPKFWVESNIMTLVQLHQQITVEMGWVWWRPEFQTKLLSVKGSS